MRSIARVLFCPLALACCLLGQPASSTAVSPDLVRCFRATLIRLCTPELDPAVTRAEETYMIKQFAL
jgi:hypothetical protein